jgi:nitrogen fixation protein FixH
MNRRPASWLMTGAGAALVVCTLFAYIQLVGAVASHHQALASVPRRATPSSQPSGTLVQTQAAGGDTIALTATPDPFGTYMFIVTVRNATGAPLQRATVEMVLTMPDMQMAALRLPLLPIDQPVPGTYAAQGVLAAGRWQAVVQVLAPGATQAAQATFRFSAT